MNYIQIHVLYWIVFNLVLTGSQFSLTPEKMSWLQNSLNFFYFDIFHGLFLPTKMTIPRNVNVTKPFWQTESTPEPRRSKQMLDLSLNPVSKSLVRHVGPVMEEETSAKTSSSQTVRWKTRNKSLEKASLGEATLHLVTVEIH